MHERGMAKAEKARAEREERRKAERAAARAEPPASWKERLARKPTRLDVVTAYRWILGRDPENPSVVARHCDGAPTLEVLRQSMLGCAEFRTGFTATGPRGLPVDADAPEIETAAAADDLCALLGRAQALWTRLGETAPHHAVLPETRFRPDRIAASGGAFLGTGRADRDLLEGALRRQRLDPGRLGRLVEFGCGTGRATLHLAALCPEVTGIDISPPLLALARQEAEARGLDHLRWWRARPDQPMPAEGYGIWFSRAVLQHNPPPVMAELLRLAFAGLAPGGVAVFQLPTWGAEYRYAVGADLAAQASPTPQIHVLPQAEVFALAAAAGLSVLEVSEDAPVGLDRARFVSHLFVVRRPV